MIDLESFTVLITFFILAPIVGAIALLFMFAFEKRIDLLENKTKKMELEKELQRSVYNQLIQRIQPHFLFNALNVILSLARLKRTEMLVKALEHLSAVLKYNYEAASPLVPLCNELDYTRHYLEIQKLRFGSRLKVHFECEERMHSCLILPFMLQTLVENSFKHGLEKKMGEAILHIRLFSRGDHAVLQVIDNGFPVQLDEWETKGKYGHGLDNIDRRLHLLFERRAGLKIGQSSLGGTMVEVYWPLTNS
jgi:sensor histidine kinase YesM